MYQMVKPSTWRRVANCPSLLLPVAALAAITPLLIHGMSCGQDLGFHIVSWLDAAQQLRQGHYPQWAIAPAWSAGEPRFVFYPPLSWLLGALLTMIFPANIAPIVFIFLVLMVAGFSMYRLAQQFASKEAALLASAFYIGNPYMVFNAVERSAMAELMAAAWMPLLLLAVLRARPMARGIAIPLALLWLTNAPAAVIGSYTLALVAILRVVGLRWMSPREAPLSNRDQLRFALTFVTGAILGLALPAFYLVPAAYERRFVQVAMAIIANMRFQDNFLFDHTADVAHNAVNHTASVLALALLGLTIAVISGAVFFSSGSSPYKRRIEFAMMVSLATLTFVIALLLVPISTPLWLHLPELAFLQFPWRLLSVLSIVLALSLAILLGSLRIPASFKFLAPLLAITLSFIGYELYAQACEPTDTPSAIAALLKSHHGVAPTDEYTPIDADNDVLRTGNPGYWFASTAGSPAPHTVPTAAEIDPTRGGDDAPVPQEQTLSSPGPHHLQVYLPQSEVLVLNLRDFPAWEITRTNFNAAATEHPTRLKRDDGLVAMALPAGPSTLDIRWRRTTDQWIGVAVSVLALLDLLFESSVSRRIKS